MEVVVILKNKLCCLGLNYADVQKKISALRPLGGSGLD